MLEKVLLDHTDPGMGIKIFSKGQEKQHAGEPELFQMGTLENILAYNS